MSKDVGEKRPKKPEDNSGEVKRPVLNEKKTILRKVEHRARQIDCRIKSHGH